MTAITERQVPLVRAIAYAVGAAVLTGAIGYGVALAQGLAREKDLEKTSEVAKTRAEAQIAELRERVDDAERRIVLLEARRELGMALYALISRNFGISEVHLAKTRKLLETQAASGGEELRALAADIGKFRVTAKEDVGADRDRLLSFAERFDEVLSR